MGKNRYLRNRFLFPCEMCGEKRMLTTDHFIPKAKGGHKTSGRNFWFICARCNGFKDKYMPSKLIELLEKMLVGLKRQVKIGGKYED